MSIRTIPTYALYGELLAGRYSDPVHHETIRERSSQHNWTIRLHRHSGLAQIFLFRSAGVDLRLGEIEISSNEPLLLVVPSGVPHGFRFSEDVRGDVVTLRMDQLDVQVAQRLEQFTGANGIIPRSGSGHFDTIVDLVGQLSAAYHDLDTERASLLTSITQLMVTYLSAETKKRTTLANVNTGSQLTRHEIQVEEFCKLVEENFARAWSVADYARQLGVSAPHLTRLSGRILGTSPNEFVRQRRFLEAKRLLEYTQFSIAEVAHRSGFRDAAFFSRSFKSGMGMSPQEFRQKADR